MSTTKTAKAKTAKKAAKNVRKIYLTRKDKKGVLHTDKRRVLATVTTLKDGTKRITQNGATWAVSPDGSVVSNISASVTLGMCDDGKWRVYFNMENTFADILDILREGDTDLSGTLEDGSTLGVFCECAEGYAESEPLDDAQAAKVREYFTPDYLTEAK